MKLRNKKTGEIIKSGDMYNIMSYDEYQDRIKKEYSYNSLAELNAEWEDYEEPKEYWYIGDRGEIFPEITEEPGHIWHQARKEIGNYFETKEDAEKVVEKLKAWKRLKDRGFIFCGYEALGCGEIHFTSDWDIEDEYEKGQRRKDLDLLFGGEE